MKVITRSKRSFKINQNNMLEVLEKDISTEELEDKEWQSLDWHDWRLATKDKSIAQYLTKQIKEAIAWHCRTTGENIPEYERDKDLREYDAATVEKINQALSDYLAHTDENSGLTGSEIFSRKYLMYRNDLKPEAIEKEYKKWEDKEAALEAKET